MTAEERRQILDRINHCPYNSANGIAVTDVEPGLAVVEAEIRPEHKNIWGIPHGGLIFSLADIACGVACRSLRQDAYTVTAGSSLNFLYASQEIRRLRAEGRVSRSGHTLSVAQAEVYDDKGNHVATGQFTMHLS